MKHTDYENIIEAAQDLTKSKAQTKEGAWRALRAWVKSRPVIGRVRRPYYYLDNHTAKNLADHYGVTIREGYYIGQWRARAELGGEKILRALKLKTRWEDLTSKRPRDKYNRELAKTRRTLARDQYGALYEERVNTDFPSWEGRDMKKYLEKVAHRFRCDWLLSQFAEPAGLNDAWQCVRDIEKNADEHGGWEQRSNWDDKGCGEKITVDLYGSDPISKLYVIQVRQSFRRHKGYFLSVRKSYFLIGYNENGNSFAHPISAGIVHGAIKRDPSPESPVKAAQAWIWGITEEKLPSVLRNGDVALIPAKVPKTNIDIFPAGEYRVNDDIAADHHVVADKIIANGAIYALNPILYHRKGQHPSARGEGWYKVVVGRRADFWSFAHPTID